MDDDPSAPAPSAPEALVSAEPISTVKDSPRAVINIMSSAKWALSSFENRGVKWRRACVCVCSASLYIMCVECQEDMKDGIVAVDAELGDEAPASAPQEAVPVVDPMNLVMYSGKILVSKYFCSILIE